MLFNNALVVVFLYFLITYRPTACVQLKENFNIFCKLVVYIA